MGLPSLGFGLGRCKLRLSEMHTDAVLPVLMRQGAPDSWTVITIGLSNITTEHHTKLPAMEKIFEPFTDQRAVLFGHTD